MSQNPPNRSTRKLTTNIVKILEHIFLRYHQKVIQNHTNRVLGGPWEFKEIDLCSPTINLFDSYQDFAVYTSWKTVNKIKEDFLVLFRKVKFWKIFVIQLCLLL